MYFSVNLSVLDCGFPSEFQLRDNSGNVFCANENRDIEGHDGLTNHCDADYKQNNKHIFYAISNADNSFIPPELCAIKSKYNDGYLGQRPRTQEVHISYDDNLAGAQEKFFQAQKVTRSDGMIKIKISNRNKFLRKIGARLHISVLEGPVTCESECLFSLKDMRNHPPTTTTSTTTSTTSTLSTTTITTSTTISTQKSTSTATTNDPFRSGLHLSLG